MLAILSYKTFRRNNHRDFCILSLSEIMNILCRYKECTCMFQIHVVSYLLNFFLLFQARRQEAHRSKNLELVRKSAIEKRIGKNAAINMKLEDLKKPSIGIIRQVHPKTI